MAEISWVIETCPKCNMSFCITYQARYKLSASGNVYFCPNGHEMSYKKPATIEEKWKKETERLDKKYRDKALENETNLRRIAALKGTITRMKNSQNKERKNAKKS